MFQLNLIRLIVWWRVRHNQIYTITGILGDDVFEKFAEMTDVVEAMNFHRTYRESAKAVYIEREISARVKGNELRSMEDLGITNLSFKQELKMFLLRAEILLRFSELNHNASQLLRFQNLFEPTLKKITGKYTGPI